MKGQTTLFSYFQKVAVENPTDAPPTVAQAVAAGTNHSRAVHVNSIKISGQIASGFSA
jgi:hypothetical protein